MKHLLQNFIRLTKEQASNLTSFLAKFLLGWT